MSAGLFGSEFITAVDLVRSARRKLTMALSTLGTKMAKTMISAASPIALRIVVALQGE